MLRQIWIYMTVCILAGINDRLLSIPDTRHRCPCCSLHQQRVHPHLWSSISPAICGLQSHISTYVWSPLTPHTTDACMCRRVHNKSTSSRVTDLTHEAIMQCNFLSIWYCTYNNLYFAFNLFGYICIYIASWLCYHESKRGQRDKPINIQPCLTQRYN